MVEYKRSYLYNTTYTDRRFVFCKTSATINSNVDVVQYIFDSYKIIVSL